MRNGSLTSAEGFKTGNIRSRRACGRQAVAGTATSTSRAPDRAGRDGGGCGRQVAAPLGPQRDPSALSGRVFTAGGHLADLAVPQHRCPSPARRLGWLVASRALAERRPRAPLTQKRPSSSITGSRAGTQPGKTRPPHATLTAYPHAAEQAVFRLRRGCLAELGLSAASLSVSRQG